MAGRQLFLGVVLALAWWSSVASADAPPRVLVVPFEPIAEDMRRETLGKGLMSTLAAELAAEHRYSPVMSTTRPVENSHLGVGGARRLARESNADYVVFGSYQIHRGQMRITGYVVNELDGEIIGSLKATGSEDQLFALQDTIAGQVKRSLPVMKAESMTNESEQTPTRLSPVQPIVYSGPLTMLLRTHTPEAWQPRSIEQRFAGDYDRYFRRPTMAYPCWGWTWGRPFSYWGPYVLW